MKARALLKPMTTDPSWRTPTAAAATAPLPADVARGSAILGVGAYLPEGVLSNEDLEAMVATSDTWIVERTGIRERRRAGSGETASMMGAAAARAALERAGNPDIDAILVATVSPDTLFPSAACLVQRRLEMPGIPALDVNAACSGFVYAMVLADSLIRSRQAEKVLVVASEAMTTLVDYTDRTTCVLFGDGAGAAVVGSTATGGVRAARWGADGREADLIHYGPDPNGQNQEPRIRMVGRGTFRLAVERFVELAAALCNDAGWRIDEVDHFVPHQANLRIVEAAARRIGMPLDKVVVNADRVGNTSAASIPLALADADAAGRLHAGERVLCVAFGAGATWGGLALEWTAAQG
jgi:3-oxoacyl-[acyl-carrier-protein] synthase-3